MTPLHLYTHSRPNGHKASIMLEETGLPYANLKPFRAIRSRLLPPGRAALVIHSPAMDSSRACPSEKIHQSHSACHDSGLVLRDQVHDIEAVGQHQPGFLKLNRSGKTPVLVDPDRERTIVESGAILFYLTERSGMLLPADDVERSDTLSWTLFQAAHVGPALGQLWHFKIFARERLPAAVERFETEARRVFGVLDARLSQGPYIAGERYGIAYIMTWPWIRAGIEELGPTLGNCPGLTAWYAAVAARPRCAAGNARAGGTPARRIRHPAAQRHRLPW